jgi:hypothetical protein
MGPAHGPGAASRPKVYLAVPSATSGCWAGFKPLAPLPGLPGDNATAAINCLPDGGLWPFTAWWRRFGRLGRGGYERAGQFALRRVHPGCIISGPFIDGTVPVDVAARSVPVARVGAAGQRHRGLSVLSMPRAPARMARTSPIGVPGYRVRAAAGGPESGSGCGGPLSASLRSRPGRGR